MVAALRSEFRKLFTVRSTYVIAIIAFAFIGFMSFYVEGYRTFGVLHEHKLSELVINTGNIVGQLAAIIAILLIIHEYRYNTITYTLTLNNSRSKVLAAKLLAVILFTFTLSLLALGVSIGGFYLGLALKGTALPAQSFDAVVMLARTLFYCIGYTLIGMLIATLVRNLALTLVTIFMFPTTIEPLLGIWLKDNVAYLPFAALQHVLARPGAEAQEFLPGNLSPNKGIVVFTIYLLIGGLVTWILFQKRDAS